MKKLKYYMVMASVCSLTMTGCMDGEDIGFDDGWQEPLLYESPYGNNALEETNVVTIKELKEKYKMRFLRSDTYEQVTEDLQIKGYVTGNDITGNIYNEVDLQDENGDAIIIAVAQGGISGYLPVGTEILIELKGLYVGNYRMQPEIGVPYTNPTTGKTSLSRMNRMLWQEHFKITGETKEVKPVLFADCSTDTDTDWDLDNDAGKLGIIKNVSIKSGSYYDSSAGKSFELAFDENSLFADPTDIGYSVSWYLNELPTSVIIYNSPYSDFAGRKLPQGKFNVTGIMKRYNSTWEVIIRDENDIEEVY